jgi:hypothetical protein
MDLSRNPGLMLCCVSTFRWIARALSLWAVTPMVTGTARLQIGRERDVPV